MHSSLKYVLMYAALCVTAVAQALVVTNKADGKVWIEAKAPAAKRDPRSPTYSTVGQGFRVVLVRDL